MSVIESDVSTLGVYADDLLVVCETALAATEEGTPPSWTSPAPPAFDCCPALIVHVSRLAEAPTAPASPSEQTARRVTLGGVILATYVIDILRCAANPPTSGRLPTPAAITAVAHVVQQDAFAIWNGLRAAVRSGDIFETCQGVHFDGGQPIREQGGCVGWEFIVRAMIPGY